MTTMSTETLAAKRPPKMARDPKPQQVEAPQKNGQTPTKPTITAAASAPSTAKTTTKTAAVLELLTRPEGATLNQMVTATGWLPHTTRAALTGLKKKGHVLNSIKADSVRTYRVTPPQPSEAKPAEVVHGKPEA